MHHYAHFGTRRPDDAGLDVGLGRASKARAGTIGTRSQSACREKARLLSYDLFVLQRNCREKKDKGNNKCMKAVQKVFDNFSIDFNSNKVEKYIGGNRRCKYLN